MKTATKKKGYALIYVMCVMLILTALFLSIVSLVASNMNTTSYTKNSNRAQLAAEAGMEAAVKEFKYYVANHYEEYFDRQKQLKEKLEDPSIIVADYGLNTGKSNEPVDGIDINNGKYTYEFKYVDYLDPTTENNVKCLEITSTGEYRGVGKKITAYVDENHISNIYQDKIFNNPITLDNDIPKMTIDNIGGEPSKDDNVNPNMITYKTDGNAVKNGNQVTLQYLSKYMYDYINNPDNGIQSVLSSKILDNPSNPYEYLNLDPSKPGYTEVKEYIDMIEDANGNNYIKDMLKYSTFYKVLMVDGDLEVGKINEPLMNYIIYCTGKVKVYSNSNLKLWNCNIYAKDMVYTESKYEDRASAADYYPIKYVYDKKGEVISLKYKDNTGMEKGVPSTAVSDIKGVSSPEAKTSILKYLMLDSDDNNDPYSQYEKNKGSEDNTVSIFPPAAAGQFADTSRTTVNESFNKNLDGYAYGLKLRYIDWKEETFRR